MTPTFDPPISFQAHQRVFWAHRNYKNQVKTKKGQVKFGSGWCETQWDPKFSRLFFAVKVPKTKRKVGGCVPNSQHSDKKQEKIQKLGEPSPKKSCQKVPGGLSL